MDLSALLWWNSQFPSRVIVRFSDPARWAMEPSTKNRRHMGTTRKSEMYARFIQSTPTTAIFDAAVA
jgi:hypothetical protein